MTTQTDYADLIRRLEAATGPDRELDRDIGIAVLGWKLLNSDMLLIDGSFYPNHPGAEYPEPTESLDAALSLVPEPTVTGDKGRVVEMRFDYGRDHYFACINHDHPGFGKTPALALCIAAIKARAAIAKGAT